MEKEKLFTEVKNKKVKSNREPLKIKRKYISKEKIRELKFILRLQQRRYLLQRTKSTGSIDI